MNCEACGAPIPEGMAFCIKCGTKVILLDEVQTDAGMTSELQEELKLGPSEERMLQADSEPQLKPEKQSQAPRLEAASNTEASTTAPVEQKSTSKIDVKPISKSVIVAAAAVFAAMVLAFALVPKLIAGNGETAAPTGMEEGAGTEAELAASGSGVGEGVAPSTEVNYDGDTYGTNFPTLRSGGYFAASGSDIYFTPNLDDMAADWRYTSRIFRANVHTGESQLVYDATGGGEYPNSTISKLQVVENRLVFFEKKGSGSSDGTGPTYHIVSIALDGSDLRELAVLNDSLGWYGYYGSVQAYDGKIYFQDNGNVCVVNPDGSERQRVCDMHDSTNWMVYRDAVVFHEYDSDNKTDLIKNRPLAGGDAEVIYSSSDSLNYFFPFEDAIYCIKSIGKYEGEAYIQEDNLVRYNIETGTEESLLACSDIDCASLALEAVDKQGVVVSAYKNSGELSFWSYSYTTGSLTEIMTYQTSLLDNQDDVFNKSACDDYRIDIKGCVGGYVLFHPVRSNYTDSSVDWESYNNSAYSYYCSVNRETGEFKAFFKQDASTAVNNETIGVDAPSSVKQGYWAPGYVMTRAAYGDTEIVTKYDEEGRAVKSTTTIGSESYYTAMKWEDEYTRFVADDSGAATTTFVLGSDGLVAEVRNDNQTDTVEWWDEGTLKFVTFGGEVTMECDIQGRMVSMSWNDLVTRYLYVVDEPWPEAMLPTSSKYNDKDSDNYSYNFEIVCDEAGNIIKIIDRDRRKQNYGAIVATFEYEYVDNMSPVARYLSGMNAYTIWSIVNEYLS